MTVFFLRRNNFVSSTRKFHHFCTFFLLCIIRFHYYCLLIRFNFLFFFLSYSFLFYFADTLFIYPSIFVVVFFHRIYKKKGYDILFRFFSPILNMFLIIIIIANVLYIFGNQSKNFFHHRSNCHSSKLT